MLTRLRSNLNITDHTQGGQPWNELDVERCTTKPPLDSYAFPLSPDSKSLAF